MPNMRDFVRFGEHRCYGFVYSAGKDIHTGRFGLIDDRARVSTYRFQFAIPHNHCCAGKRDQIFGHVLLLENQQRC